MRSPHSSPAPQVGPRQVALACSLFAAISLLSGCPGTGTADAGTDPADAGNDPDAGVQWDCVVESGDIPSSPQIGCRDDYLTLASDPIVASIPGAQSLKTVIDRVDDNALHFINTKEYAIHWEFASAHLSGNGLPIVPDLGQFNTTEYYSPQRRFLLGALTYFAGPDIYAYEIAPYDTASVEQITEAFLLIRENAFFGDKLRFHPTSQTVEIRAQDLDPAVVPIITTDELFAGIDYQPLNLAESYGKLRFVDADELDTAYLNFRDIVVLDSVPNDISVVNGIITEEFQTPLSHINVLSQNRGTPNMGLRNATANAELLALADKWVRLDVDALAYTIEEVTEAEADAWWEDNRPPTVQVPSLDLNVTGLWDLSDVLDDNLPLGDSIRAVIPAFGGKASNYAALESVPDVSVPKAFGIPVSYYWAFMEDNGFNARIADMLDDDAFNNDPATRDMMLAALRDDIRVAPVDPAFDVELVAKLETDYPNTRMRFRSSTNAEDLDGFTGAGLYTSKSGELGDPEKPVLDAIRKVWASVWFFRAFEERSYRGIDHTQVGMAILAHRSFPDEDANGVALTANPFDATGLEPGFYVNVQEGEASVVKPDAGVTTDQFIYQFDLPGQPIIFYGHSSLIADGETVLTTAETFELGAALKAIHQYYRSAYGPPPNNPTGWYAMDVEFKFDTPPGETESRLFVKQARPHPGRGE